MVIARNHSGSVRLTLVEIIPLDLPERSKPTRGNNRGKIETIETQKHHKTIKNKVKVPMNKKTRSLNVAMSVAIISAEALRQNNLLK